MSVTSASTGSPPAPAARRRWGRDLRLVLGAAGFTSLFWIALIAFAGPDLFGRDVPAPVAASSDPSEPAVDATVRNAGAEAVTVPQMAASGRLRIPVEDVDASDLVDTYDAPRGSDRTHEALDILAPSGTPVVAAAEGTVEKLFFSDAGGKTVYVRSPDGERMFYYAHLDAYAPELEEGAFVRAGEALGTVGTSGNADPTVPHLHFAILRMTPDEAWWEGVPQNPYPLLTARR